MNLPAFEHFREWVQTPPLPGTKGREADVYVLRLTPFVTPFARPSPLFRVQLAAPK